MQPAVPAGWVSAPVDGVAGEDRDRVAEEGADVDVRAVGADDDDVGRRQRAAGGATGDGSPEMQPAPPGSWRRAPVFGLRRKVVTALLAREVA